MLSKEACLVCIRGGWAQPLWSRASAMTVDTALVLVATHDTQRQTQDAQAQTNAECLDRLHFSSSSGASAAMAVAQGAYTGCQMPRICCPGSGTILMRHSMWSSGPPCAQWSQQRVYTSARACIGADRSNSGVIVCTQACTESAQACSETCRFSLVVVTTEVAQTVRACWGDGTL